MRNDMFSTSAVRSREDIKEGLLTRAFERGGASERDKMQLLIEWRIAACRHSNEKAAQTFSEEYKVAEASHYMGSGSRGIDAFNWLATIEGRDDRLADISVEQFEKKIADMAHMHDMVRFFKNSEIVVDIEAIRREKSRRDPNSPIIVKAPDNLPARRSKDDPVYVRETEKPVYLKTLAEIDAEFEKASQENDFGEDHSKKYLLKGFTDVPVNVVTHLKPIIH